jgi:predicted permease
MSGVAIFLLSASGIVLLVASFNLANMLLARGRSRRKEFAIRLATGGSRSRLVRQLLTENLVVALIGAAGGLLLTTWAMSLFVAAFPSAVPVALALEPSPDGRVLLATLLFAVLGTLVSGLGPALHLARADVIADLREHATSPAPRRTRARWLRTRDALVTGQLALTLVLLSGAGLFVRGAFEAARTDPGFTLDRGILVNIDTSLGGFDAARTREVQRGVLARVRALPGVEHASLGSLMPFAEFGEARRIQRAGPPIPRGEKAEAAGLVLATTTAIADDYFAALGVPLVRGRGFSPGESAGANGEKVAIIDVTLAARLFGERDGVGELIQFEPRIEGGERETLRVVGVAGGIRDDLFDAGPQPFVYTPIGRELRTNVYLHVKTGAPTPAAEAALLPDIRRAIHAVDRDIPIVSLETRPMFRERNLLLWVLRAGAEVTAVLAVAALVVALVGVYGVKAYLVARRTREIGVRVALGARPGQVMGLVFREGLPLAIAGLVLGVGLSLLAGQLVRGLLFQGRAFDVPVILAATCALLAVSALATWIPARRALGIQPTQALRAE